MVSYDLKYKSSDGRVNDGIGHPGRLVPLVQVAKVGPLVPATSGLVRSLVPATIVGLVSFPDCQKQLGWGT